MENTLKSKHFGIDGFQLKILAMILMVFDHIHYFLGAVYTIPMWFTYVGRVVAPIFIFMSVEGFFYTHNKKKYMLRLYIASVIMALGSSFLSNSFPRPDNVIMISSMFGTIFLITIHLSIIDFIKKNIENKKISKILLGIFLLFLPTIISMLILVLLPQLPTIVLKVIFTFIPTTIMTEGGIPFIVLGIILYLFRGNKLKMLISYAIYVGALYIISRFNLGDQIYMIFAIPIIALYNGEKGKSMKYLFYIFYPVHIWILYLTSYFLLTK